MGKTKDELEDEELYEVCKNCGSLNLTEYSDKEVVCGKCGATNYTKYIKQEEWEKISKT